ncbi:MAG: hypothetical protein MJY56_00380 [Bacteroidales bacterium]|nr:hypothetical protein [Bacteroidales bacterium]
MSKRFYIIITLFLVLSSAFHANAQKLSTLAPDGSVTSGKLPDGLQYTIVTSTAEKGRSEYALLQRACQSENKGCYSLRRFGTFTSSAGVQSQDSILFQMVSAAKTAIDECDSLYGTDNQTFIIIGDVDRNAVSEKLRLFSYMVPASAAKAAWKYPYEWKSRPLEAEVFPEEGLGVAKVKISYFSSRPRADRINTIYPTVSKVMMETLGEITRRRLEDRFPALDLPVANLGVSVMPIDMSDGDQSLDIEFAVGEDNLAQAIAVVASTAAEIGGGGVQSAEILQVSDAIIERFKNEAKEPILNATWLRRVVSSLVTGTDLASPATKVKLFTDREIADSTVISSIKSIASATYGNDENIRISVSGGAMTPGALENVYEQARLVKPDSVPNGFLSLASAALPSPSPKKYKPKKTVNEKTFAGTEFRFANGLRVFYRQMNTGGKLYWSAVMGGGTSSLEGAVAGESAYLDDIFSICTINGFKANEFLRLMESKGMTVKADVNFDDCFLRGEADSSNPDLFFRFLLSILNGRAADEKAYEYYEKCESLGSMIYADDHIMERLEKELQPGYAFSEYKTGDILADDFYERAERFYAKRFGTTNDGALIVVGDITEYKFLTSLRMFADQFRTSAAKRTVPSVSYRILSGERSISTDYDLPAVRIVASGLMETTMDNRLAVGIADMLLSKVLSSALKSSGWEVRSSLTFSSAPKGHINLRVSANISPECVEGGAASTSEVRKTIMRELRNLAGGHFQPGEPGLSKSEASTAYAQRTSSPLYWLWIGEEKVTEAKDYNNGCAAKLSAIPNDSVQKIFSTLYDGGRIIL